MRQIHEVEIIQKLGIWGYDNPRGAYTYLKDAIQRCMLPEGKDTCIDDIWIKNILCTEEHRMFPAPARFQPLTEKYVEKGGEKQLAEKLVKCRKKWICLHATAGAGKTTFVNNLNKRLPEDSAVVIYDCYGGGVFLQPDQPRHTKELAIRQICNMLALECGTELLLGTPSLDYNWWGAIKDRIEKAAAIIKDRNPEAIVAIIIDAADNSVHAANMMGNVCFLKALLELDFPQNVKIIVTARTERMEQLPYIEKADKLPIPLFEKENSVSYIKGKFADAEDRLCEELHKLTKGNPRLQNYLLSSVESLGEALDFVRPNGKCLEDIFDGFIQSIKKQYAGMFDIDFLFYVLSFLLRPIPCDMICELCQVSNDALQSLSVECHLGFYIENNRISFRDEDFEEYLRLHFDKKECYMSKVADYIYDKRNTDAYCMRYAHIFFNQADQIERLVEIALDEEADGAAVGVTQVGKIILQRIRIALGRRELREEKNRLTACKLVYREIDYYAGEDILSQILYHAPEEIAEFCDEMSVRQMLEKYDNSFDGLGKKAFLSVYALKDKGKALEYIKLYENKMYAFYKSEQEQFVIDRPDRTENIVRVAEASVYLGKFDQVHWLLTAWKPKKASVPYVFSFYRRMLVRGRKDEINHLLKGHWSYPEFLAIGCAYISEDLRLPEMLTIKIEKAFDRMQMIPLSRFSFGNVITYFEYKMYDSDGKKKVGKWIEKLEKYPMIDSRMSFYDETEKREAALCFRFHALKCACEGKKLDVSLFYKIQEKSRETDQDLSYRLDNFKLIGLCYDFRIKCLYFESDELHREINNVFQKMDRYGYRVTMDFENQRIYEIAGFIILEGICLSKKITDMRIHEWIQQLFGLGCWTMDFYKKAIVLLSIYSKAQNEFYSLLAKVDKMLLDAPESAESMADTYLLFAKAALRADFICGKDYFGKAVACTREADSYSYQKICFFQKLAKKLHGDEKNQELIAYKLANISENYLRKMTDTKNFPYKDAISAVTILGKKGIWSAICRMDDRNQNDGLAIEDTLPIVLDSFLEEKVLEVWQAAALSIILLPARPEEYFELMKSMLKGLDRETIFHKRKVRKLILNDILFHVQMYDKKRLVYEFVRHIDQSAQDPELDVHEIMEMYDFFQKQDKKGETLKSGQSEKISEEDKDKAFWDERMSLKEGEYVIKLEEALSSIADGKGRYSIDQINCVAEFVEKIAYKQEVSCWRADVKIKKKYFMRFADKMLNYYWEDSIYEQLNRIFKFSDKELFDFLLCYLGNFQPFRAEELVQASCFLSNALSDNEALELLDWSVGIEWEKRCAAYGDAICYADLQKDDNANIGYDHYISMFLWRLFGHPDKKNRALAQHALWRYLEFDEYVFFPYFLKLYKGKDCEASGCYTEQGNFFFLESAQISFLEASLYLADRMPEILRGFYSFYEEIACNDSVQHALGRHIALKICQKLKEVCEVSNTGKLEMCECCMKGVIRELPVYERENGGGMKLHFHFSRMDTLPYWYDNVAELFGCTQGDVAQLCDFYIKEYFGITEELAIEWQKKYYHQQYHGRGSNDHGCIPSYETLRKYAEWHAMFYAADYLRKKNPVAAEDGKSRYGKWLDTYLPGKENVWRYELSAYPPLLSLIWDSEFLTVDRSDEGYKIPEDFVEKLMTDCEQIILDLDYSGLEHGCRKSVALTSVLVDKCNLYNFISELKKNSDAIYDFLYRKEEGYYEKKAYYVYETCVNKYSFSGYASDQHDPLAKGNMDWRNNVSGLSPDAFSDIDEMPLKSFRVVGGDMDPFRFYKWCEPESEYGYDKKGTDGCVVTVDKKYLKEVIGHSARVLVCKIKVELEDDYYSHRGKKRESLQQESIWIMWENRNTEVIRLGLERTFDF